jgi:DNA-binding MarR family transcriptional regulator
MTSRNTKSASHQPTEPETPAHETLPHQTAPHQTVPHQQSGHRTPEFANPGHVASDGEIDMGVLPSLMGYMLRQAFLTVSADYFVALETEEIRQVQFSILEVVKRNPGIRPSEVAAAIGVKRANMVPLLTELERRGMIHRETIASDRRAQALALTDIGETQLRRLHTLVPPHEDRLAERLGPNGREQLLHLLHALVSGSETDTSP